MSITVDIGCGQNKRPGAVGIDCRPLPGVDLVCDFERGLPFRTDSVSAVYMFHVIEHVRDLMAFMEELYRVLEPDAKV